MNGHELAIALRNGQRVYGTCVTSTAPGVPGMIGSLGLDLAFIDTEHTPIDREQLSWICRAYSARNIAPIVRIPEPDPYRACMALDAGAHGIIGPYVETVEQVRELRGALKLRPLKGQRLRDVLDGKETLADDHAAYLERWNWNSVLIVNIESTPALEALDDILAEPGLDAVLVGPHDLSISLGIPEQYAHADFNAAISTIIRKARAASIGVGIHFFNGIEPEIAWAKEGANLIMHSSDLARVREAFAADFERFRKELGEAGGKADATGGDVI